MSVCVCVCVCVCVRVCVCVCACACVERVCASVACVRACVVRAYACVVVCVVRGYACVVVCGVRCVVRGSDSGNAKTEEETSSTFAVSSAGAGGALCGGKQNRRKIELFGSAV